MNWTVEKRYSRLEEIAPSSVEHMAHETTRDPGYPRYHIAPKFGLLNDPNGLCHFNGEHHIFYQWTPVGPVHGIKYWYHLSTRDFVNFTDHGVALHPDQDYDSHGVYSGSALVEGEQALLFFTGNKRDQNWIRTPTQCYATMDAEGTIEKQGVIVENTIYTEHFRDPKVWKKGDEYFMVVGAQTRDKKGTMALYHAQELGQWQHKGQIKTTCNDFGYMWECPDFFELDGKAVMLFSPQGVSSSNSYDFKNIFSVAYLVGEQLNLDTMELEGLQEIRQPDYGFDFYAPQTYVDDKGRRIMLAWIGLPDIDTPSVKHQWAGMLTLPRELSVEQGYLVQKPLEEIQALRGQATDFKHSLTLDSTSFCLSFETDQEEFSVTLRNHSGEKIQFSATPTELILDRSEMSELYAEEFGLVRKAPRLEAKQQIEMYVDGSVIEIFLNNGKHTMTSRFFISDLSSIEACGELDLTYWPMANISGLDRT
ncbi:sucrose-6-phosphate hydrolase [Vibrio sp. CAU 1672]|uniref:sucrose-6-phosphate hydrolase n=1 Tax=Vibrio sp. CAU 1672 TaxID=3032594 RepID=UPI0023DBE203|nr:sucrose-6-phosphate hydrolase [Vibrio sp. CAU 1672]MDF2153534.1 sucrose-6-phosphate hydrolase [Vibrio sp. CAU 1672]